MMSAYDYPDRAAMIAAKVAEYELLAVDCRTPHAAEAFLSIAARWRQRTSENAPLQEAAE
jgi:hypothetical protein